MQIYAHIYIHSFLIIYYSIDGKDHNKWAIVVHIDATKYVLITQMSQMLLNNNIHDGYVMFN